MNYLQCNQLLELLLLGFFILFLAKTIKKYIKTALINSSTYVYTLVVSQSVSGTCGFATKKQALL